jgi:hypothetical protein
MATSVTCKTQFAPSWYHEGYSPLKKGKNIPRRGNAFSSLGLALERYVKAAYSNNTINSTPAHLPLTPCQFLTNFKHRVRTVARTLQRPAEDVALMKQR